jgi:hypothetical protein
VTARRLTSSCHRLRCASGLLKPSDDFGLEDDIGIEAGGLRTREMYRVSAPIYWGGAAGRRVVREGIRLTVRN